MAVPCDEAELLWAWQATPLDRPRHWTGPVTGQAHHSVRLVRFPHILTNTPHPHQHLLPSLLSDNSLNLRCHLSRKLGFALPASEATSPSGRWLSGSSEPEGCRQGRSEWVGESRTEWPILDAERNCGPLARPGACGDSGLGPEGRGMTPSSSAGRRLRGGAKLSAVRSHFGSPPTTTQAAF